MRIWSNEYSHYDKDKDGAILYDNGWETFVLPKAKRKLLVQDALYWAQRGAASGNTIAQSGLAWCMYNVYLRNESQSEWRQAARKTDQPRDKIEIDAFWFDKITYWREQSLQNGLLNWALKDHTLEVALTASQPRKIIEEYKWGRLWEIQVHFRKLFARYDDAEEESESSYDRLGTNVLKQHLDTRIVPDNTHTPDSNRP